MRIWNSDSDNYEQQLIDWFEKNKPEYFRWCVSGDIHSNEYFQMMLRTSRTYKNTKFLLYTKQYEIVLNNNEIPTNMSIRFSYWPGLDVPHGHNLGEAYIQLPTETRIPSQHFVCTKYCPGCDFLCWNKINMPVVFMPH